MRKARLFSAASTLDRGIAFRLGGVGQGSVSEADGMPAEGTRCRRLVKDYRRYATTLTSFHGIAFVGYMLKHAVNIMQAA